MISLVFNGAQPDTGSSPFYDYLRDALYVGDDNGVLHKFINVFGVTGATPSEVVTGNWPITVDTGTILTSPTLDCGIRQYFPGRFGWQIELCARSLQHRGDVHSGCGTLPWLDDHRSDRGPRDCGRADCGSGHREGFRLFRERWWRWRIGDSVGHHPKRFHPGQFGHGTAHHLHSGAFDNTYLYGQRKRGAPVYVRIVREQRAHDPAHWLHQHGDNFRQQGQAP